MPKIRKWKTLDEKDISPSHWYPLFKQKIQLPNGKIIDDYYLSRLGDVATILPITKNREVILVRQYKQGVEDITLELPAGRVKKGETPEETAVNELAEETGAKTNISNLEPLGILYPASTKDSTRVFGFLARDVAINSKQKLDVTEEIEVVTLPIQEVFEKIKTNKIKPGDSVGFIFIANLRYPELFNSG